MPNMAKVIMYNNTCYCWSFFVVIAAGGYLTAAAVLFSSDKIENQNSGLLASQFRLNYIIG